MVSKKTRMLGIPLLVVLDESGNGFEHESGASLEFNGRLVQSYSLEWDGRYELVLMLKKIDDDDLLVRGVWECFFKALALNGEAEDFQTLSKEIYIESFLDHLRSVEGIADELWASDNHELFDGEVDWFIDHDYENFEG